MATSAKTVQSRLDDWCAKEQEEQQRLLDLTAATREDAQNRIAQATSRIYQLRNRLVVGTSYEGGRHKKAAKTQDEPAADAAAAGPSSGEQQQEPTPAPAGPSAQPQGAQGQQATEHDAREQPESDRSPPHVQAAGKKRGPLPGRSAASAKRAKAQQPQHADGAASGPIHTSDPAAAEPPSAKACTTSGAQAEAAPAPQQAGPAEDGPRRVTRRAVKQQSQPAEAPPKAPPRPRTRQKKVQEAPAEEAGVGSDPMDTSAVAATAPAPGDGNAPLLPPSAPSGSKVEPSTAEAEGHAQHATAQQDSQPEQTQEVVGPGACPPQVPVEVAASSTPGGNVQQQSLRLDESRAETSSAEVPGAVIAPDTQQPVTVHDGQAGRGAASCAAAATTAAVPEGMDAEQQHARPAAQEAGPSEAAPAHASTQNAEVAADNSSAADAEPETSAPAAEAPTASLAMQAKESEQEDGQPMDTGAGAQRPEAEPVKSPPHPPRGGRKQRKAQAADTGAACGPMEASVAAAVPSTGGVKKQRQKDPADAPAAAGPSEKAADEAAPAAPVVASRVTRSRRGAPAAPDAAAAAAAPAPKPVRTKATRQKRDMKDAQIGSPGLHPKTKQAVEEDDDRPAAAGAETIASEPSAAAPAVGASGITQEQDSQPQERAPAQASAPSAACPPPPLPLAAIPPPPGPPPPPPPVALGRFGRMPAAIAATVAMLGGKPVVASSMASVNPSAAPDAAAQAGATKLVATEPSNPRCPAAEPVAAMQKAVGRSERGFSEEPAKGASTKGCGSSTGFCFGTKAKEHSSPDMPHFGQPADQGAAAGRSTCDTPNGKPETPVPLAMQSPVLAPSAEDAEASAAPVGRLSDAQELPETSGGQLQGGEAIGDDATPGTEAEEAATAAINTAGAASAGRGEAADNRPDPRHRSLSLSVTFQPARLSTHDAAMDPQQSVGSPLSGGGGIASRHSADPNDKGARQGDKPQDDVAANNGDNCDDGAAEGEAGPAQRAAEPPSTEESPGRQHSRRLSDGQAAAERPDDANEGQRAAEADVRDAAMQDDQPGPHAGDMGASGSAAPALTADGQPGASQQADGGHKPVAGASGPGEAAQPSKPKGGNLVSSVRSFLPVRVAPSPPPAAGKKVIKVKALEAAQAAKQKEAARAAERAQARAAAADRHKQGQPEPTAGIVGMPKPTPAKSKPAVAGASILRGTPPRTAPRPETDAVPASGCPSTMGAMPPAGPVAAAKSTAVDDKRNDGVVGSTAALGSVKARAAFFQEQAKKAAEQGSVRRPAGTVTTSAIAGAGPSYKTGAAVRSALAVGESDTAIAATAAAASAASAVPGGATASRAAAPVPGPAVPAVETVADKHKRVEAKRREEEERRRAELEARTKAKDDKLRNLEAAKQQQRLGGGGAGALRPVQPVPNPLAVCPPGKRQPLNVAAAGAGPSNVVHTKPEPECHRTGPVGPSAARTPGTKAAPNVGGMVSPAIQMQIKLLPAVHPQNSSAAAQGNSTSKPLGAGVTAGVPGLPKPQPPKSQPQSQWKGRQPSVSRCSQPNGRAVTPGTRAGEATPGAGDLTEEERRNVHAIQTSPYIVQVKPRTPGVTTANKTATKKPFTSYEISPYRSDSDDDGGDDDDSPRHRRKPLPDWAAASKVLEALQAQQGVDPDAIFGSCPKTIDIVKVFADMPPPGLTDARGRPRRDYRRRGSSGNWEGDELS